MEQKGKRDEEEERGMRVLQTATVNYPTEEMRETEMKSLETSSLNEGEKKKFSLTKRQSILLISCKLLISTARKRGGGGQRW